MTGFPLRTALIVAPLLASILSAAPARAEVIERVVAVVNDEALFLSELRRRSAPYLGRVMSAPSEAERIAGLNQLYQELLQRMIDEVLIEAGFDAGVCRGGAPASPAVSSSSWAMMSAPPVGCMRSKVGCSSG